jgi:integrase
MAKRREKGEGSLLKINGRFWYAQYYDRNGKQIRVSTRTEVKQEALGVLRKLMGDRDNGLIPISDLRKIHYGDLRQALVDNYVSKEWTKACAAVGLGRIIEVEGKKYDPRYVGLTIHDFLRSAIRNLIDAGVPEKVAMSISGHKTRSVFDRYHIVSTENVTDAMRRVEAASLRIGSSSRK